MKNNQKQKRRQYQMKKTDNQILEKKGKPAKCNKCSHEWIYTGESEYYISCPRCLAKVKSPYWNKTKGDTNANTKRRSKSSQTD